MMIANKIEKKLKHLRQYKTASSFKLLYIHIGQQTVNEPSCKLAQ